VKKKLFKAWTSGVMASALVMMMAAVVRAQTAAYSDPGIVKWGFLAAALVAGIGTVASAIAVAVIGAAALGALSEKPELAGRALIFLGLAEGLAIYGLIIAIMILGKI
jgi:V/A-type H+-transporting ATPase subunit K